MVLTKTVCSCCKAAINYNCGLLTECCNAFCEELSLDEDDIILVEREEEEQSS